MVTAKCHRCGGISDGKTFEEASAKINHAVGLSRGIKCGASYGKVKQVKIPKPLAHTTKVKIPKLEKPKDFLFTEHKDKKPKSEKPKISENKIKQ